LARLDAALHGTPGTSTLDLVSSIAKKTLQVLVYSDDALVRAEIISALGRRPTADGPLITPIEVATEPALRSALEAGAGKGENGANRIDLVILDGEAAPAGGMGVARAMKDEIYNPPKILLITGRPDDAWLASWSRADAVLHRPIDPFALDKAAARLFSASGIR